MQMLKKWQRKWRAKGHGIHSPFAFHLIKNILYSPYAYNAFFDIKNLLSTNNINPESVGEFNYLSFRLIHHFKPANILEIGSGIGINTLFLAAAHSGGSITCIENNAEDADISKNLLKEYHTAVSFKKSLESANDKKYDAIFIHTESEHLPDQEALFALSHENTFWVFHPARHSAVKPLLRNIVKDNRVRVVFDMKQTSILFLYPSYHKTEYFI